MNRAGLKAAQSYLEEELKKLKSGFAKGGANTEPEFKL